MIIAILIFIVLIPSHFPEQDYRIVPVDEPVVVEIEGSYRLRLLDPVGVPEEDNCIVPVANPLAFRSS